MGNTPTSITGDTQEVGVQKRVVTSSPACNTRLQSRRVEIEGSTSKVVPPHGHAVLKRTKEIAKIANKTTSPARNTRLQRQKNVASPTAEVIASETQEKQHNNATEILSQATTAATNKSPDANADKASKKRGRGKTKMLGVHTRKYEDSKEIMLNEKFQPISDVEDRVQEFSLFLGTIARENVSLTYKDWRHVPHRNNLWQMAKEKYIIPKEGERWVLKAMRDHWKVYKCRIKGKHFDHYDTDEERLANRPEGVPLADFVELLEYWGSEKAKEISARNRANRRKVTDTHTVGPRSYAQIKRKLQLAKPNGEEPSKAEMFIATHKRNKGKKYKTNTDVINYRVSALEEMCTTGANDEAAAQLMAGENNHGPTWLVGRHALPKKINTRAEASTSKMNDNLKEEVQEIVRQTVQHELTSFVKRLLEGNPGIAINLPSIGVPDDDNIASTEQ